MIVDLKEYVSFLCKHNMSGDQFLFCCLVYEGRHDLIYKMINEKGAFDRDELRDLEDRKYVINKNVGTDTYTDMYEITKKFKDGIYEEELIMWNEFLATYPQWLFIEGKRLPAQSANLDELKIIYFNKIGKSVKRHKEIIDLLIYASDHDLINMGIDKWIKGEQWRGIQQILSEKPKSVGYGEREL